MLTFAFYLYVHTEKYCFLLKPAANDFMMLHIAGKFYSNWPILIIVINKLYEQLRYICILFKQKFFFFTNISKNNFMVLPVWNYINIRNQ